MADSIFDRQREIKYHEEAALTDFAAFRKIVESRRSVRVYEDKDVPAEVVRECLQLALLAPNSSNLQPWEFYWVRDPEKKKRLVHACFNQPAAATAPVLIVCVARTRTWRRRARQMTKILETKEGTPKSALEYYKKMVPAAYGFLGPFGIIAPIKWLVFNAMGFFAPMVRDPVSPWGLRIWAHKTVALACENLMLAFRAAGYDSCPMEGFDEDRVKKILRLKRDASVTMVISAGRRAVGGVYGERIRFPADDILFEV